jgi:hypothetical protein
VLRDSAAEADLRVLVISVLGAPERRLLGRRRTRRAEPEPAPAPVPTTRVTVIRGQQSGEEEAREWLADPQAPVDEELAIVNDVLHLHRVATADASARDVTREQALVVRVGYGRGEEVAEGRWTEAVEPPPPRAAHRGRREAALRPQVRLAALHGGRDAALACEELVLRARADFDAGRHREAALQVRVALEAAIAELEAWRERSDIGRRLEELRTLRGGVGDAANHALKGGLDEEAVDVVETAILRIEAAQRARTAGGFSS